VEAGRGSRRWWLEAEAVAVAPLSQVGSKARTLARHRLSGLPVLDLVVVPPEQPPGAPEALRRRLGGAPYIVRSSAVDEDLRGASQAGRYLSLVVVAADSAALLDALRRVRRSGPAGSGPIPVLIQPHIQAPAAGVAFTRHPLRRSEACLEAALATTEGITRGTTEPEFWSWDRWGGRIVGRGRRVGRATPLLSASAARRVLELALRLEAEARGARDIEWAWSDSGPILLQDRPLLLAGGMSQYFLPERFPWGVSRFGWSMLGPSIERCAVRDPLRFVGLDLEHSALSLRHGTPHLSREATRALFYYFPQRFIPDEVRREHAGLRLGWWLRLWLRPPSPRAILRTLVRQRDWLPLVHRYRWRRFLRQLDVALGGPPLTPEAIAEASPEALRLGFAACRHWSERLLDLHRWSIVHAELIWRLTGKRELPRPGHATARARRELEVLRRLAASGVEVLESRAWRRFRDVHGHRADSIDPAAATWAEDPSSLLALLRRRREPESGGAALREPASLPRRARGPGAAEEGVPQGRSYLPLRGAIAAWWRFALELREDQRFHWHRILARLRALALRCGALLVASGQLEEPREVFQFTLEEVLAALAGGTLPPPEQARAPLPPAASLAAVGAPSANPSRAPLLRGLGVSSGRVSGPVCHVHSGADLADLPRGAILVTRAADPAWSPAFDYAGALVQELGGALSHAAILARESGIPAVVGVADATTTFAAGELVQVDGSRGTVTRLRA
jgi:pyruvate,water dikinase